MYGKQGVKKSYKIQNWTDKYERGSNHRKARLKKPTTPRLSLGLLEASPLTKISIYDQNSNDKDPWDFGGTLEEGLGVSDAGGPRTNRVGGGEKDPLCVEQLSEFTSRPKKTTYLLKFNILIQNIPYRLVC